MKPQDEIIKYLMIDGYADPDESENMYINIKLDKKNLKLLKELHGTIGLDEFMQELLDKIKGELNGCIN